MLDILLPIGGPLFFSPPHDDIPKLLKNVNGKPLIYWALQHLERIPGDKRYVLIGEQAALREFRFAEVLSFYTEAPIETVTLDAPTQGAACSVLMAIEHVDRDREVLVASLDQYIDHDLSKDMERLRAEGAAAGIWHFDSVHPKWSYARLDNGAVVEVREKEPISTNALTSLYWFAKSQTLFDALMETIRRDSPVNGQFYLSPCLNELVLTGQPVAGTEVDEARYFNFYDMQQLLDFERNATAETALVRATRAYVAAFDAKNLDAVAEMMDDGIRLMDSFTPSIHGKPEVVAFVGELFEKTKDLRFTAKRISRIDTNTTAIEFLLNLDGTYLEGVDVITWRDGRMTSLDAYLHTSHPER